MKKFLACLENIFLVIIDYVVAVLSYCFRANKLHLKYSKLEQKIE